MKKFLSTMPLERYQTPHCRWVEIDDNNFVNGETPVEDFGCFWITDHEVTPDEAFKFFMEKIAEREEIVWTGGCPS